MKTPMPIFDAIERRLKALNKFLIIIGAGFLLVEAALTILNITGRYVFNTPVKSTYEVTSLLMIIVLSLCWPYTANEKGHVRVDVLEVFFSKPNEKSAGYSFAIYRPGDFHNGSMGSGQNWNPIPENGLKYGLT